MVTEILRRSISAARILRPKRKKALITGHVRCGFAVPHHPDHLEAASTSWVDSTVYGANDEHGG